MDPGHLIATYVLLLYTFLAPLVLFGIFVLFDVMGRSGTNESPTETASFPREKDPAVWTKRDIAAFRDQV